jgi:hypothetical protein
MYACAVRAWIGWLLYRCCIAFDSYIYAIFIYCCSLMPCYECALVVICLLFITCMSGLDMIDGFGDEM